MKTYLALCALALPMAAADYLPLAAGNSWTYRDARTGQQFTIRAGTPEMHHGNAYYPLFGYAQQRLTVRINEAQALVHWDEERERDVPVVLFTPFEGGWWEAPYRECDQEAQTQEKPATHDGPAGPLPDVLDIRYRTFGCADVGTQREQFAANIGMVRRIESSIAGPRQFDLVSARIGKQTIETLPHGRFTVTVMDSGTPHDLTAVLRLQTGTAGDVRLRFDSGQEFDVMVRDQDGHALWTWSATRSFIQAQHERTVVGEWTVPVEIPRAVIPPNTASITVEGWLTTAPRPIFAAAAPVTLQ